MSEINGFISIVHQTFYALLALFYAGRAVWELDEIKERSSLEKRRFFVGLFGAVFLGLWFYLQRSWSGEGLFFAAEFAFFVALGLFSPKYAAGFFLFLLLTRPWESVGGPLMETMPRDYFYVAALSLAGFKLARKDFTLRFNGASALLAAFAVWVFVSAVLSSHSALAVRSYTEVFFKGVVVFYLLQNSFEKESDSVPVVAALVLAILDLAVVGARNAFVAQTDMGFESRLQRLEAVGILANSNDIAAVLVLALPFCVFFFLRNGARSWVWPIPVASAGLVCALIWAAQSRGALLAAAAAVFSFFAARIKSKKALFGVFVAAIVAVAGMFGSLNRSASDMEGSANNRAIYWLAGINMAVKNPLFGVGFWGFNENFAAYALDGETGTEGEKMTAHSAWIQVLAETGFVGFALYLSFWFYAFWRAWEIRLSRPEYLMSLVGYGCAASFLSHAYQLYPYILIALTATQSFLVPERKSDSVGSFAGGPAQGGAA